MMTSSPPPRLRRQQRRWPPTHPRRRRRQGPDSIEKEKNWFEFWLNKTTLDSTLILQRVKYQFFSIFLV